MVPYGQIRVKFDQFWSRKKLKRQILFSQISMRARQKRMIILGWNFDGKFSTFEPPHGFEASPGVNVMKLFAYKYR